MSNFFPRVKTVTKQFFIVLVLLSTSAWAEWTSIGNTDIYDIYVDISTVRKKGNYGKMWTLFDFKTVQRDVAEKPYLSSMAQDEFDCDGERSRTLYLSFHSKNMGIGDNVWTRNGPDAWTPSPPGSVIERLWKVACGKQGKMSETGEKEQQKSIEEFMARIQAKIRAHIVIPPNMSGNPEAIYDVTLFAGGGVKTAVLVKTSGVPAYDEAVRRAIRAAEPLPLPAEADLFQEFFRELRLNFRPNE